MAGALRHRFIGASRDERETDVVTRVYRQRLIRHRGPVPLELRVPVLLGPRLEYYAVNHWIAHLSILRSVHTVRARTDDWEGYLHYCEVRRWDPDSAVVTQMSEYLAWNRDRGLRPASRRRCVSSLFDGYMWLSKKGLAQRVPFEVKPRLAKINGHSFTVMAPIAMPVVRRGPTVAVSQSIALRVLEEMPEWARGPAEFIARVSPRICACLGLKAGEFHGRPAVREVEVVKIVDKGDNAHSVFVEGTYFTQLAALAAARRPGEPLFRLPAKRMTDRNVYEEIRRASKRLGVRLNLHKLRHGHCTWLYWHFKSLIEDCGADVNPWEALSWAVGWTSTRMAQTVYVHAQEDRDGELVTRKHALNLLRMRYPTLRWSA